MFLLDDILMIPIKLPIAGFNWIMKQIQTMANEELLNDQPWKERLIELQMMLEVGDISEEEYTVQEAQVFQALRDIRARREEMGIRPVYKTVDTCGAEFEAYTPYLYSTFEPGDDESRRTDRKKIVILGGGAKHRAHDLDRGGSASLEVRPVILFTTDPASNLGDILRGEVAYQRLDAIALYGDFWTVTSGFLELGERGRIPTRTSCAGSSSCRFPASTS
jgi:hypothetical protein